MCSILRCVKRREATSCPVSGVHPRPGIPGSSAASRSLWRTGASCIALLAACDLGQGTPHLDDTALRTGVSVYAARCASCHGERGEGAAGWTRPGPSGVYPAPPHDSTGHTWHHADGLLYRIVARGTAGALKDTLHAARYGMPAFESALSAGEIRAVITYLKSRWTPAQRRRQAEASRGDPFPASTNAN